MSHEIILAPAGNSIINVSFLSSPFGENASGILRFPSPFGNTKTVGVDSLILISVPAFEMSVTILPLPIGRILNIWMKRMPLKTITALLPE